MVMETVKGPLRNVDWQMLGHTYDPKAPSLPTRRLDVPLPPTAEGLYQIAHMLSGLINELHSVARLHASNRSAIVEADALLSSYRNRLKLVRAEWETELREAAEQDSGVDGKQEHLKVVG